MAASLAVVIVSTNEAQWLGPCLSSVFAHAGGIELDVIVVDNESSDGTRTVVEADFPDARVVDSRNRGFSHANNRGVFATCAPFVLFLNPDTEVLDGTFRELLEAFRHRPTLGLAGVKQVLPDGAVDPTIRRYPTAIRAWAEALASERLPFRASWLGERELDLAKYDHETDCDWTSGSFMLARREALESGGYLDERFFIYSEEVDLCLRIKQAGWEIRHFPQMTIRHHTGKAGISTRMTAQSAFARRQYVRKHFTGIRRSSCITALYVGHGLRAVAPGRSTEISKSKRAAARAALRVLAGLDPPPFGQPPVLALDPRS
jgi:N-acetylglucosaminyl-diphospho-decaprenol L-rhamnosyltransferase